MKTLSTHLFAGAAALCAWTAMAQSRPVTFEVPPQWTVGAATGGQVYTPTQAPFPALSIDLNHDGYDDFVTVDWATAQIFVTLGGSQGFQRPLSLPCVAHPVSVAAGDLNRDGNIDLVVAGDSEAILFGNGDGTFQPPEPLSDPNPSGASYVALGDFNGDGKLDVALATFNGVTAALGNGDGTFGKFQTTAAPHVVLALYPGDFHNSGNQDLIVAGVILGKQSAEGIGYLFNTNRDGTFQDSGRVFAGSSNGLALADMNGDGNLDLVMMGYFGIRVFLGDGKGGFAPKGSFEVPFATYVAAVDLNGDGKPDVVVASETGGLYSFLGNGDGTLKKGDVYMANTGSPFVAIGSYFEADRADIAALNYGGNRIQTPTISLLRNNGKGHFPWPPIVEARYASQFALADMNGDGNLDLIVGHQGNPKNSNSVTVTVAFGNGRGYFGKPIANITVPPPVNGSTVRPTGPLIADFDGDGKPDFAIEAAYGSVSVGLQQAANKYQVVGTLLPIPGWPVWAGDLNGDGMADLLIATDKGLQVMLSAGQGTFHKPVMVFGPEDSVAVADFNQDGKMDLAIGTGTGGPALLLGNGDGTFGAPAYLGSKLPGLLVRTADFNGDRKPDLVTFYGSEVQILLNDGAGGFTARVPQDLNGSGVEFYAVDLDHNGFADIVTASEYSEIQIYHNDGHAKFSLEPDTYYPPYQSGSYPFIQFGDVNNDGKLDLLCLGEGITVLLRSAK